MPAATTEAFVARTVAAGTFAMESSELAAAKSRSDAVRRFASGVVQDHARASTDLEKAVADAGLMLPPARLDGPHRFIIEDLRGKEAADFDKEFVQAQYNGQVEIVEMFRAYANSGEDAGLRRYAAETLPVLEARLAEVKKLRK